MSHSFSIIVISLAGSPRRERVSLNLNTVGVSWSFFDALREPTVGLPPYSEADSVRFFGRGLSNGEIGCAASHMQVLTTAATSQDDAWILVIEDDVVLDPGFHYPSLVDTCKIAGINYLRLYARHAARSRHVVWLGQRELIRFERAPMGTQAYLISNSAARAFLDSVETISRPVDWEMDRFWANSLYNYAVFPFPCFELTLQSSIAKATETTSVPTLTDKIGWFIFKSKEYFYRWWKNAQLRRLDKRIGRRFAKERVKLNR
jgi:GR25 family glycosyltransferase involved in LPS biosynthesis